MANAEGKEMGHTSGSEPENKDFFENADTETASSEDEEVSMDISEGLENSEEDKGEDAKNEENNKGRVDHSNAPGSDLGNKNASTETVASERVKLNAELSANNSGGGEKKEEIKKEQDNKGKENNTLSTTGETSRKRKRKKAGKPGKKFPFKKANVGTAASEAVKMNIEVPAAVSEAEEKKEENEKEHKENENNKEVAEKTISTPGKNSRKRKRKNVPIGSATPVPVKDSDKPETSKVKDAKKSDSRGMIFMCSSNTKQDCYRYKVFGLPAAKKDMVAKIYKGMRLFLFDIDLKLLYGIYKAAGPGGFNIEPKAFNSAFPSQVRFSAMKNCLPLAEEKFKAVIKENYYGNNKFDCQLKAEQVKNLCELFKVTAKKSEMLRGDKVRKTEVRSAVDRSRERREGQDKGRKQLGRDRERRQGRDKERKQLARDKERRQGRDRERQQLGRDRDRRERVRSPAYGGNRRVSEVDGRYEREVYAPTLLPPQLPTLVPLPLPLTYAYERPVDMDYYRREALQLERPERRDEISYRDPHGYSRDPPPAREPPLSYHESLYARAPEPPLSYHESLYTTRAPAVHEAPIYREPVYTRAPPSAYNPTSFYRY